MTPPHSPLSCAFAQARPGGRTHVEAAQLEPLLEALVAQARARWPGLEVDAGDFVRFVAERLPADAAGTETEAEALGALATDDLYLALGCLRGNPLAHAAFERTHLREVGAFVAHLDRSPAFADEVRQALRERCFAGPGEGSRLAGYTGSGALGGWVRVAALRTALNLRRGEQRAAAAQQATVEEALGTGLGPELAYLKAHSKEAFAGALRAAVEGLPDRERTLLRLYHLEGLSLEAMAALYRVHLSTVSRWLARAREEVASGTTRRLRERLGLGASEAQSLAALVLSQLDLSLARLLRGPG